MSLRKMYFCAYSHEPLRVWPFVRDSYSLTLGVGYKLLTCHITVKLYRLHWHQLFLYSARRRSYELFGLLSHTFFKQAIWWMNHVFIAAPCLKVAWTKKNFWRTADPIKQLVQSLELKSHWNCFLWEYSVLLLSDHSQERPFRYVPFLYQKGS